MSSVDTPTTEGISENIVSQISASLNQSIPMLPRSFVRVLAKALAGVVVLLYKYAGFVFLQLFVRTATLQRVDINGRTIRPLEEWGVIVGVGPPAPATRAELLIELTVTNQEGMLRSGTQLINSNTGVTYITLEAIALDDPTKQVSVRAVSDQQGGGGRGVIGNMDAGETLNFASPPANVERSVEVIEQEVTGADLEDTEDYRQRVIQRFRERPQGGALADWRQWSVEPAGIVNTYPYSGDPGWVDVYVEATEESSGSPDGIPTAAQITEVEASINQVDRRPLNSRDNVQAITRTGFNVEVVGLDTDNQVEVEGRIETACDEYLRAREPFILGLSVLPRTDVISAPELGGIVQSVVAEEGGTFQSLEITEGGTVVTDRTLGNGEKAKLASITFTAAP